MVNGKNAPTLGRRMLALEKATDLELFRRLAKGCELTEPGTALLKKAVAIEKQILPTGQSADAKAGFLVNISGGSWMTLGLYRQITTMLQGKSSVLLWFVSSEVVRDIWHYETTIGIRNQRSKQADFVCRKIGAVEFAGYATGKTVKPWVRVLG
ncbi:MAG: hypothetical protein ACR2PF_00470 [Rhizobiaceae bacterium]